MPASRTNEEGLAAVAAELAAELEALGAESHTQRAVKRTAPWAISIAVHVGVLVIALVVAGTVRLISEEEEAPVVIADFDALRYDPVTRLDLPPSPITEQIVQDKVELTVPDQPLDERLLDLELDTAMVVSNAAAPSSPPPFGSQPSEGGATFAGLSTTNANEIVFVIDASGSLIAAMQIVLNEVARSLEALTPEQSFSIILFQADEAFQLAPAGRLTPARRAEKERALEWARRIIPNGTSNPLPALRAALALKPDVIFLLSDNITGSGVFEIDQSVLLAELDEGNPVDPETGRRRTQINCIQFLDPDPLNTLEIIAREHGGPGGFKFLDRRELGLARP